MSKKEESVPEKKQHIPKTYLYDLPRVFGYKDNKKSTSKKKPLKNTDKK